MEILHCFLPLLLLASTSGLPVRYDQRQEGELNVHAHLENFIIVLIPSGSTNLLDLIPLRKQNTVQAKPDASNQGTKVSAPDFPAGKSPYKVDIDKSEGEKTDEKEVLIAHVPSASTTNSQVKSEDELIQSATATTSDEESSTNMIETTPPETKEVSLRVNSDKKENAGQKIQIKEEEKTEMKEDKKEDQKTETGEEKVNENTETKEGVKEDEKPVNRDQINNEGKVKLDDIPVIDTVPAKPAKTPKSIDFGVEAAKPRQQSFYSSRVKTQFPSYRPEVAVDQPADALRLKMLRTGIEECEPGEVMTENGECLPSKFRQRSGHYFPSLSEDKLLPILQYGVSAANDDQSN